MTASGHSSRTEVSAKPKLYLRGLALMATLALLGWGLKASGFSDDLNEHWIDIAVKGHGMIGAVLLMGVGSVAVAVGLPRQAVCFLAGYAFGFLYGFVLASLASLFGCVACFYYARLLGRELVMHRFAKRVAAVDSFLGDNPFLMTVLIRFLPVGSNLLTNLVAGVSSVRPVPFFAGSLAGYVPQTIVFVLLGSGVAVDANLRLTLSVALFLVSAALGGYLYRRLRHGKSLGGDIDGLVGPGNE